MLTNTSIDTDVLSADFARLLAAVSSPSLTLKETCRGIGF